MNKKLLHIFLGLMVAPFFFASVEGMEKNSTPRYESIHVSSTVENVNVKGTVTCDGKGVPDVEVSDGYEVTLTDTEGQYELHSKKQNGYVFISIPSGYEVASEGSRPIFFQYLTKGTDALETKDFTLKKVDDTHYYILCFSDVHLAARNNDTEVFDRSFIPDINATIKRLRAGGAKVYGIALGDLTWDLYWYKNHFGLKEYLPYINKVDCPVFNVMGNHDNDPYSTNNPEDGTDVDWNAARPFKKIIGPSYYSFNLGKTHYVVLDDIQYLNDGGSDGTVGARNYRNRIVGSQMDWLKKDLATVRDKKAPLVIAMHIPLYNNPELNGQAQKDSYQLETDNAEALKQLLSGFSNVHLFTGHTHLDYNVTRDSNLYEHNTPAVCATWWWTSKNGYAGNMICKDGTPAGYGIYDFNGDSLTWQYKAIGYEPDYQFRTYDLNRCQITADKYAPSIDETDVAPYASVYAKKNLQNQVLINVWNYDPSWKIEVTENGVELPVKRVFRKDPLHIISYEMIRLRNGDRPTKDFVTTKTAHLFLTQASSPVSTLTVKATDRFGNVYTQEMKRPKELSCDMK